MAREFDVVIEKDEDGYFVGNVVELPGCHTQAKSMDELIERLKEAIELYLESFDGKKETPSIHFVGIQKVAVDKKFNTPLTA